MAPIWYYISLGWMMFTLTKKTDYAIIALSHMAQNQGQVCNAREIAERFHVPSALLMNILKTMAHEELVRSVRGAKGGYILAVAPEDITLDDIIAAIEGPVRFVQCAGEAGPGHGVCDLLDTCPVQRPVRKVHEKLKEFLTQVTLADIAFDSEYALMGLPSGASVAAAAEQS